MILPQLASFVQQEGCVRRKAKYESDKVCQIFSVANYLTEVQSTRANSTGNFEKHRCKALKFD
jgi:hypothetical protein